MTNRQRMIVGVGLLISALFIALAFNGLKPGEVLETIQKANGWLLLLAAAWYVATRFVIALRWGFLLRSTKVVPLIDLVQLVCIGYMGNNVYPLRAGEILRVLLLKREHQVPIVVSTTVILVERLFDGIVLLSFVVVAVLLLDVGAPEVRAVIGVAAPLFAIALVAFFALALNPKLFRSLLHWVCARLPSVVGTRVQDLGEHVIDGLAGLRTPADLLGTIVTSYATWLLEAVCFWMVAWAFGLNLDYLAMLLTVGVVNLAGLIPASPGQFGVFEGFTLITLASLGIANADAIAFGLAVHFVIWLPVTVIGFVLLVRKGLSLTAVTQAGELARREEALT